MNFVGSTMCLHSAAKNTNFCLFFSPEDQHTPACSRDAPGPQPIRTAKILSETTTCQRSALCSTANSATSRLTGHLEQTMLLIRSATRATPSPLASFFGDHPATSPLPWPEHNLPHTQERSHKLCPIAMSLMWCHPLCALQSPCPHLTTPTKHPGVSTATAFAMSHVRCIKAQLTSPWLPAPHEIRVKVLVRADTQKN